MIFGKKILSLPISLFTIVLMGFPVSATPKRICIPNQPSVQESDKTWTIDRLMEELPQGLHHLERFRETYTSSMLTQPIVKEGTLQFTPPFKLEKHVLSPFEEIFIAEGDTLRYENPEQGISTTFAMREIPTLSVFILGLRSLFTGNVSHLRQHFHLTLTGTDRLWSLHLRPVTSSEPSTMECIQLLGINNRIRAIEVQEINGDHSSLRFLPSGGQ